MFIVTEYAALILLKKRGMLSVKNILEHIQTIYEGLNILFVTFSRFKIVCQSS